MKNVEEKLIESKMVSTVLSSARYLYELEKEEYSNKFGCLLDIINLDNSPIKEINNRRLYFLSMACAMTMDPGLNERGKSFMILCFAERLFNEEIIEILQDNKEQFIGTNKEYLVKRLELTFQEN